MRTIETPPGVQYWGFELDPTGTLAALVSGGEFARRVDVIDIVTGDLRKSIELRDPVYAQFSPDGQMLAVTTEDSLIRLYDTDDFVERVRLAGTSGVPSLPFFTPDGSRLTSAAPGEIRSWSISAVGPPVLGNFEVSGGPIDRLVVAEDESTAYATVFTDVGLRSAVHRVGIRSGEEAEVIGGVPYYFSTRPLVSPDLTRMTTLDAEFLTSVVDLPSGDSRRLARCDSIRAFDPSGRLAAVDAHLVCFERRQDPGTGHSRLIDLATQDTVIDLGAEFILYAAAFSPDVDGRPPAVAAVEERSGEVTVYNLETGDELGTYTADPDWPISIALSSEDRLVLLMASGRLVAVDVTRLADGDDATDPQVFDIPAHNAGSKALAVSESGLIATGSSLDGVRVWSPDGELVVNVPTRQADAPTFAFAPGTDTLYYEDGDGVVRRLPIDVDELTQLAHEVLTRGFTQQECDRYFAGEPCPSFD
jgi:WD40 repeat protein